MARSRQSKRNQINQNSSNQPTDQASVNLQQNNIYHMDASEIDALRRMQESYPEIAQELLGFRQQELNMHKNVIAIEETEQNMRKAEVPYIRWFAFLGQFMTYSLTLSSLIIGVYFAFQDSPILAGIFITATSAITSSQFLGRKSKKEE